MPDSEVVVVASHKTANLPPLRQPQALAGRMKFLLSHR